jgi:acid phosphatase type 7
MNPVGRQIEWDDWFDAMGPLTTTAPLMPVQGNHEVFADIYYDQFALPASPTLPDALKEHAWSLDVGNVHFVGLDSNGEAVITAQVAWLEADLQAARADPEVDWIVCMMHHAPYSASNHGSDSRLQAHFSPLWEKYKVDLVFSGHDHNYERSHPIAAGKVVGAGEGPVYVVAGAFFAPPYGNGKKWWTATSVHGNKGNWVIVDVEGDALTLTAMSGDGAETLDVHALSHPAKGQP